MTATGGISGFRDIDAVGHRVVHGGERFSRGPCSSTTPSYNEIEETIDLAPLHNPHNLKGIRAVRDVLGPDVPQVAVFDTAFHHTLPDRAYLYAIPYSLYRRHRVRRYGFHGTSHRYVAYRYRQADRHAARRDAPHHAASRQRLLGVRHRRRRLVDTSMGFTPLEGLVMGTRSGDLDPAILDYIAGKEGMNLHEVEMLLNKQSGLLGISGLTNDMRELLAEAARARRPARPPRHRHLLLPHPQVHRQLPRRMGGADAVVFTGGIGENAPRSDHASPTD
jgi:acetate kinase